MCGSGRVGIDEYGRWGREPLADTPHLLMTRNQNLWQDETNKMMN